MKFGDKLRSLRNKYNLTQTELAEKLNLSKANISKYESGNLEPNIQTITTISKLFNVSVDYLLKDEPDDESLTIDEEFQSLLSDPKTLVAFKDFQNLTDTDKQEIINFIKFKKQQNN
ncbi:transcriptional regulator with XRE-family HTH domain [Sedimentibacter acidaminivorans]|uniref:Transcriptional regulator with XRE-family HTH domain n=1 Tax=Sedimentibacter acidaminivorans TaxID=913099 RepID=A0ABS4GHM3_9FIRM|nr:helix-turn-helix transcriptional regulator [Sedimentibacter acidaminivorans]MBP1926880.1 transcriptional regulator with XRE-family HTH domain [Sedimentibacter acidaminivorans]